MTIKSKGRQLGRLIRKITGIGLPIAMKLGKMVAQKKTGIEMEKRFPEQITNTQAVDGCLCCNGIGEALISGPKGSISGDHSVSAEHVEAEARTVAFREKDMKAAANK